MQAQPPSPEERYRSGQKLRERLPRNEHAEWTLRRTEGEHRMQVLTSVDRDRVHRLLPEKYRRMSVSPFAFYRGAAALMAADLSLQPRTGMLVQICGDAHVRNLGAYATVDERLVFDLNDFDETLMGPWEWDIKRMATSLQLASEQSGQSPARRRASVRLFVESYRKYLREFAACSYHKLGHYLIARRHGEPLLDEIFRNAQRVTPSRNLQRLTTKTKGTFRFHDESPLLEHVPRQVADAVLGSLQAYAGTLGPSRRWTFERYRPVDVAFKLVGTGSVGTRDYVVLLFGNGVRDPLFIQVKQELPSCYEPYVRSSPHHKHQGRRVAEGQQLMQTLSDPFLGYTRFDGHDYLVRQLADHKAALDPQELKRRTLAEYARLCGEALAKGHARSGDAARLAGYLGRASKFDDAVAEFAAAYARQTKIDYHTFLRWSRGRRHAPRRVS